MNNKWVKEEITREILKYHEIGGNDRDLPGVLVAKTVCFQYWRPRFDLWSENRIPCAATKSSQATAKDPACCNEDQRSRVKQLRPGAAKSINK